MRILVSRWSNSNSNSVVFKRRFSPMTWYNQKLEKSPLVVKSITTGGEVLLGRVNPFKWCPQSDWPRYFTTESTCCTCTLQNVDLHVYILKLPFSSLRGGWRLCPIDIESEGWSLWLEAHAKCHYIRDVHFRAIGTLPLKLHRLVYTKQSRNYTWQGSWGFNCYRSLLQLKLAGLRMALVKMVIDQFTYWTPLANVLYLFT